MMITPISHYTTKRNKHGIEYEPNGGLSRKIRDPKYIVYVARPEGASRIKVGRTGDAKSRMSKYEGTMGVPVRFVAQFSVDTLEDAKRLESDALKAVGEKFARFKREWFLCERDDVPTVIEIIKSVGGDVIRSVRAIDEVVRPVTDFERHAHSVRMALNWVK